MKDITGQKFGMLTAVCPTNRRQHGSVIWEFQCDCGWTTHKSLRNLRFAVNAKHPPSCGCIHKNYDTYRQMIGRKYGSLLVVDIIYSESKKQYCFICLCDCGKTKHISPYTLLVGGQKSCSRNCSTFRPTLPPGIAHARQIYAIKKYSVLRQQTMKFNLTFEEFYNLSISDCSICGMHPHVHWNSGDSRGNNGIFIHNKIAYADPEIGFVMGNIFPVCLEHSYEIRGLHYRGIIPINYGEELCLKNG